ncbi:MAG: GGDEF domain-containing protein [Burkholderiales bacterium]|nr:GGDEF domain-containing protein [Burkholderiales bacterium]
MAASSSPHVAAGDPPEPPAAAPAGWRARLRTALLGREEWQQRRLGIFFMSTVMYVAGIGSCQLAVWTGAWAPWQRNLVAGYLIVAHLLSYLVERSAWSRRLSDETLMVSQIGIAASAALLAYAMGGFARSGLLLVFGMQLMFMMLTVSPRRMRRIGWATILGFVAVSVTMQLLQPERFPLKEEVITLSLALGILPVMLAGALKVTGLRARLVKQQAALQAAMDRLQEMAGRDQLTGLHNRHHMVQRLAEALARQRRQPGPLCLALLDLDHFKRINDQFGHQVGDRVLQDFARAVGGSLRATDELARWGGEEFLVLLPHTAPADAQAVIERLREAYTRAAPLAAERPQQPAVTFSAGLVEHRMGDPIERSIERADQALYRAKDEGRNRTALG